MNTHDNKHNDSHCKTTDKKTLVVIGGGFAGLNLVKRLNKRQWDVVVIDRFNFHSFPPLFYQVASAGLDPGSISFPLRREMRQRRLRGCTFHLGEVSEIDSTAKTLSTQYETLHYDTLVIAAGTTNNFFGNDSLQQSVYTLKSVPEAIRAATTYWPDWNVHHWNPMQTSVAAYCLSPSLAEVPPVSRSPVP